MCKLKKNPVVVCLEVAITTDTADSDVCKFREIQKVVQNFGTWLQNYLKGEKSVLTHESLPILSNNFVLLAEYEILRQMVVWTWFVGQIVIKYRHASSWSHTLLLQRKLRS